MRRGRGATRTIAPRPLSSAARGVILCLAIALSCSGDPEPMGSATDTASSSSSSSSSASGTDSASSTTQASTSTASTDATTSSTSEATLQTTSDTSESDTACSFLCSDLGPICVVVPGYATRCECDIFAQDCPDDQKCTAWANDGGSAWNATRCVPVDPAPKAPGDACTVEGSGVSGIDDCDASSMCWSVDPETNQGYCAAFCKGDYDACSGDPASCCEPGFSCTISNQGSIVLCLHGCDPILQDCEDQGEACYPVGSTFQCAPDVSGDMGAIGDPCEFINVCDPGSFCGDPAAYPGCDPNAAGCCIPFCELDAPACAPMTECQPWYEPMDTPPGYENVGVCVLPP